MRLRLCLLAFVIMIVSSSFTYYAVSDCLRSIDVCFGTNSPTPPSEYAPFKYRLVEPFLTRLANPYHTEQGAVVGAIVLFTLLTMVIVPALYIWLRRWVSDDRAMIGVMVYALVQVGAFHIFFLTLSTAIETCLVLLTLLLVTSKWWGLAPLIILATFNRETGVILGAIYVAYHGQKGLKPFFALVAIWAGITAGLHIILGPSEHVNGSLLGMFLYNAQNWLDGLLCNLILLPLYWLTFKGFKGADVRFKRLALVGVAYLVASWVGGNVGESMRYILVSLPLFLPLLLSEKPTTSAALSLPR